MQSDEQYLQPRLMQGFAEYCVANVQQLEHYDFQIATMVGCQLEQLEHAFVVKVETEMKYSCHFVSGQKKMGHKHKMKEMGFLGHQFQGHDYLRSQLAEVEKSQV